jgi:hypothetical protein
VLRPSPYTAGRIIKVISPLDALLAGVDGDGAATRNPTEAG